MHIPTIDNDSVRLHRRMLSLPDESPIPKRLRWDGAKQLWSGSVESSRLRRKIVQWSLGFVSMPRFRPNERVVLWLSAQGIITVQIGESSMTFGPLRQLEPSGPITNDGVYGNHTV